ncbi:MAG TPA: hypothetical protein VM433_09195 [Mycobacteriales bacterium]|nr:hypothetical protein [Mycobacteriales bacterium]
MLAAVTSHAAPRVRPGNVLRSLPPRTAGALAVVGVVLSGHAVVLSRNRHFFFQDDVQSYYAPLWVDIGRRLRDGELPVLAPSEWMAGNYLLEAQVGLWNPAQLLIALLAPSFANLAVLAATVAISFAVLLGTGTYRAALAHGADVRWAVSAGAAAPFAGWTLWYDSATWVLALVGTAFVTHAWASAVRYADGAAGPLPAFAWLYLALSTGYPYAALGVALLSTGLLARLAAVRSGRAVLLRLALLGAAAASCAAITYLPALLSRDVTLREAMVGETFVRDYFVVEPWQSLAALVPTHLPAFGSFEGPEQIPSTWIAWFLLPALAVLDWRRVRARAADVAGPAVASLAVLLWVAGPAYAGPLRWPARMLPYLAVAALVTLAVAASAGTSWSRWPLRVGVMAGLVAVGGARAVAGRTDPVDAALGTGLVVVLAVATGLAWRLRGARLAAGVVTLSVLPVLALQLTVHPRNPNVIAWGFPADRAAASDAFPDHDGSTLQLADVNLVERADRSVDRAWSALAFGNYARGMDRDHVNGYTPIGHQGFRSLLCERHAGTLCDRAREQAFARDPATGSRYVDLLAVRRVVLQRAQYPTAADQPPPPGWAQTAVDPWTVTLERTDRVRPPGDVAAAVGVEVGPTSTSARSTTARVSSAGGGLVVLSRLAWPGYAAALDGRTLPVTALDDVFLAVEVPPGTVDAELVVRYEPPGWRLGTVLAALGALVLAGLVVERRRSLSRRAAPAP